MSQKKLHALSFNQRITPITPARPIQIGDLLKRLKTLQDELSSIDQENFDTASLHTITKQLISQSLLANKDKAVRILTACCLADVLRLFAPDAPYSQAELRDIFDFFARQLTQITDSTNPYFPKYYHLLDSLATVRSIVLVVDLNADALVVEYFRRLFDVMRPELSKNVYQCILDILTELVQEAQHLPSEAVALIVKQFSKKRREENPAAHKLAIDLCNTTTDKLQRYICQYFGDEITSAASHHDTEEDDEESGMETLKKVHELIKEINGVAGGVLFYVLPLLSEELKAEDTAVRFAAIDVLGDLFAEPNVRTAATYKQAWTAWVGRRKDKEPGNRALWVDKCLEVVRNYHSLAAEISEGVMEKLIDPDDKVRVAALKFVGGLDVETAGVVGKGVLEAAGERLRDKKSVVRAEAFRSLSKLFNLLYNEIVSPPSGIDAVSRYGWIPGKILETLYLDDPETKISVEKALHEELLPPNYDDEKRTERLVNVLGLLSDRQWKAFGSVIERQAACVRDFGVFVEVCEKFNGGTMDKDEAETERCLGVVINHISSWFPAAKKQQAQTNLHKFAKNNDGMVYKLLKGVMDPQVEYKPLLKTAREVVKRLETHTGLMDTFSIIIRRISLTLVPKSSIPCLIQRIRGGDAGGVAERLIKEITTVFPAIYKNHLEQFKELVKSDDPALVTESLNALARFVKTFPDDSPQDEESINRLRNLVMEGTTQQAKYAMIVLAHMKESRSLCVEIIEKIVDGLNFGAKHLDAHLSALAQLALCVPDVFEEYHTTIVNFIVKELLLKNRVKGKMDDEDWIEYEALDIEGQMKVLGVKVLVNRVIPKSDGDGAVPVLKLLKKVLESDGELVGDKSTPAAIQTHLRLTAAKSYMKLASIPVYHKMISVGEMYRLALIIQDPIYQVRNAMVEKLCQYLIKRDLPFDYLVLLMLAAHEPEAELKGKVKNFLARRAKILRNESGVNTPVLENTLVKFLHLLAHHPDFSTDVADLHMFARYIEFFLEVVATSENVSFMYYSAGQLKMVKDLQGGNAENLYVLSELTQLVIQEITHQFGWSLPSYPGSVHLPKELFKKMHSKDASENIKKSYLPQQFVDERANVVQPVRAKKPDTPKKNRSRSTTPASGGEEMHTPTKRKAKQKASPGSTLKKPRKSIGTDDEEPVVRKTAPRSAKSNRKSLKDVSDEELDEMDVDQDEDQDHASPVKRKPVAKKSDDLWDVDTGDEDATMPKSNLRGATPKRGRGRGSKPSSTRKLSEAVVRHGDESQEEDEVPLKRRPRRVPTPQPVDEMEVEFQADNTPLRGKSSRVVPPLGTSDKSKPVEEDVEEEGLENGKTTMDDTEKNDDVMVEKLPTRRTRGKTVLAPKSSTPVKSSVPVTAIKASRASTRGTTATSPSIADENESGDGNSVKVRRSGRRG